MKKFLKTIVLALISFLAVESAAFSQVVYAPVKISSLKMKHATVGTSAALAIAAVDVVGNLQSWAICHDAASANDYLAIAGDNAPATNGMRLDKGRCYECVNCSAQALKAMYVVGSAASTGYSVVQHKGK